jgi:hypothetical protein
MYAFGTNINFKSIYRILLMAISQQSVGSFFERSKARDPDMPVQVGVMVCVV